jgi:DNA-binding CsgD family transcriptional regulator/tetratricopeptide (TPR) repeat protein
MTMWDNFAVTRRVSSSVLVGRSAELALLEDALADAVTTATTVLVSGEPGIGKSRLISELCNRAASDGWLVATGGCSPVTGPDLPYGAIVRVLRSLADASGDDALQPALRALGHTGVTPATTRPDAGELGRTWLFETILEQVAAVAGRTGVVIVVEDIQWADHGTQGVLDYLTRNLGERAVLLVCTCRSDALGADGVLRTFGAELARGANVRRIELVGLERAALAAMAADIFGGEAPPDRLDVVVRLAGGNPFFAEELLAASDCTVVPAGLRDVVMVGVEQLSPGARHALGAASVFGDTVEHRLLAEVVDLEGVELDTAVREALRQEVLVMDGAGYRFRHDLLRETLYATLLPEERRRLHGRLARVLDVQPDLDGRLIAELARHWWNAGDFEPALRTSLAAADAAMTVYAFDEALGQFERVLDASERLANAGQLPSIDRAEVLGRAADAAYWGGRGQLAVAFARAAVELTDSDADPKGAARCWTRLGRSAWAVGDPPGAAEALAEAERLLAQDEPSVELARVQCEQARWLMLMSRNEQAEVRARQAIRTAQAVGCRVEEGHASNTLGVALCQLGRPDEGLALLRWSLEVAEEIGDPEGLNRAYSNLASCLVDWARLEEAAALTLDMVAAGEQLEGVRLNGATFSSADALVRLGRWDEAGAMARDYGGVPSGNCASNPLLLHATLALLHGEPDSARPLLEEVGSRTASLTDVQFRGSFHLLEAQLALLEHRFADASDAIEEALDLVAGTDEQVLAMEMCAVGIRAVVDGAVQARAQRRRVDDAKVRLLAAELIDKADEIADRPRRMGAPPLPRTRAWLAQCRAEAARTGPPAPELWQTAAAVWESLNEPFGTAYCRWRQAEALLTDRSGRSRATALVTDAWLTAVSLGAERLCRDIEDLARRARIEIGVADETTSAVNSAGTELGLTQREIEVLGQLAAGRSDAHIAEALFISKKTASVHVSNILRKLGVSSRMDAGEIGQLAGLG